MNPPTPTADMNTPLSPAQVATVVRLSKVFLVPVGAVWFLLNLFLWIEFWHWLIAK
jgi:hypothetical protein